jgi:hypothetical protein
MMAIALACVSLGLLVLHRLHAPIDLALAAPSCASRSLSTRPVAA